MKRAQANQGACEPHTCSPKGTLTFFWNLSMHRLPPNSCMEVSEPVSLLPFPTWIRIFSLPFFWFGWL